MSIIAALCVVPRDDCGCFHCQLVQTRRRLSNVVNVVQWYESVIAEMGRPEELDDYHRGYFEALTYMTRDLSSALESEGGWKKKE